MKDTFPLELKVREKEMKKNEEKDRPLEKLLPEFVRLVHGSYLTKPGMIKEFQTEY